MTTTLNEARRSVAVLVVHPDGSGTVDIDGRVYSLAHDDEGAARHTGLQLVIAYAHQTGQAVLVTASDQHTEHRLLVDPDGTVRPAPHTVRVLADCDLGPTRLPGPSSRARWLICALAVVGICVAAAAVMGGDSGPADAVGDVAAPTTRLEAGVQVAAGPAAAADQALRSRPRWAVGPVKSWRPAAAWQARSDAAAAARRTAAPRFVAAPLSPAMSPQYQPPNQPSQPRPERQPSGWEIPGNPAMPPGPYTPQTSP